MANFRDLFAEVQARYVLLQGSSSVILQKKKT